MFLKHIILTSWYIINITIKKMIDLIGSLLLVLILLIPMLIISIVIKMTSKGPIIFIQKRLTKHGKEFNMLKFRTMIDGAEQTGTGLFSFENDPRITKVGNFLRKTSLDELPQLFNILTLKMSFVGPRPPVNYELGDFKELSQDYKNRFRMSAGITGLAQISGRNELDWDLKVIKDNEYIDKFKKVGFLLDIYIVFKTIIKVFQSSDNVEEEPDDIKEMSDEEKKNYMSKKVAEKATNKKEKNNGK